jgi:hypothetical protein
MAAKKSLIKAFPVVGSVLFSTVTWATEKWHGRKLDELKAKRTEIHRQLVNFYSPIYGNRLLHDSSLGKG